MYSLEQIVKLNRKPAVKAENNFDRQCSYSGDADAGIVLHSALLRNTIYLQAGKSSRRFLKRWELAGTEGERNQLVEAYFQ
jgi:hypothetical protein